MPATSAFHLQSSFTRPVFPSVTAYTLHVGECLKAGRAPWEPRTRAELAAVVATFPREIHRFLPATEILDSIGLPVDNERRAA